MTQMLFITYLNHNHTHAYPSISIADVRDAVRKHRWSTSRWWRNHDQNAPCNLHQSRKRTYFSNRLVKDIGNPVYKKGNKLAPEPFHWYQSLVKCFCVSSLKEWLTKLNHYFVNRNLVFVRRGTVGAIYIVRQILEKSRKRNVPVHLHFIDFKAAFDTIWRKALWKMLRAIGIDPRIVDIIENLYKNTKCAVVINLQGYKVVQSEGGC